MSNKLEEKLFSYGYEVDNSDFYGKNEVLRKYYRPKEGHYRGLSEITIYKNGQIGLPRMQFEMVELVCQLAKELLEDNKTKIWTNGRY